MKFLALAAASIVIAQVFWSCAEKPKSAPPKPLGESPMHAPAAKPATSAAPADSIITRGQFVSWFACNGALDSLSYRFTDTASHGGAAPEGIVRERAFSDSQDLICVRNGLAGGYKEYRWIINNLGSPRNKALYDSLCAALKAR